MQNRKKKVENTLMLKYFDYIDTYLNTKIPNIFTLKIIKNNKTR